jgi:hypothetical protein
MYDGGWPCHNQGVSYQVVSTKALVFSWLFILVYWGTMGKVSLRGFWFLPLSYQSNSILAMGSGPIIIQSAKET